MAGDGAGCRFGPLPGVWRGYLGYGALPGVWRVTWGVSLVSSVWVGDGVGWLVLRLLAGDGVGWRFGPLPEVWRGYQGYDALPGVFRWCWAFWLVTMSEG